MRTSTGLKNMDLSLVKMKLMDCDEGRGWTKEQCDFAESEYKRFLNLILVYGDAVPTKAIDIFWHQHILDTRAYESDCRNIFGKFLHHFPYFGMFGNEDHENLVNSFEQTKDRYFLLYNEKLDRPSVFNSEYSKCHDCNGKCSRCNNG